MTLLSVMNALRGDGGYLNWSAEAAISTWDGVTIEGSPPRVTWLLLRDRSLNGSVSGGLSDLSNLEYLSLRGNDLTGTIPAELGSLSGLKALSLGRNSLTGTIPPELGSLTKLELLRLDNNQLSGTIPVELGRLSSLVTLLLNNNNLNGAIPSELGNLDRLTFLWLADNQFTGCIPEELSEVQESDLDQLGPPFCDASTPTVTPEPTPEPAPTPTSEPTPELPADRCVSTVSADGAVSGSWSSDCASEGRPGSYASYYTFTLTESADVTITLESSEDTYLFLREGAVRDGSVLYEDDDHDASEFTLATTTDSGISETLAAGSYTIEAATYNSSTTGDFTLTISGLPAAVEPTPTPVLTPEPTPSPTPEPAADSCVSTVSTDGTVGGSWSGECESEGRAGSYARYYPFTLTESADVTITLESSEDTYLFLREGAGRDGSVLYEDDDHDASAFTLNSRPRIRAYQKVWM